MDGEDGKASEPANTPPAAMPAGPWVVVIGCHRSGTSAVTGALAMMGLHGVDPADRIDDEASNPEHWESLTASLLNDDLLASQAGSWDAPPALDAGPPTPDPAGSRSDPVAIMSAAYPEPGPLVWKDPRACLLLPYWRSLLPGPLTAVFLWREPLAVARSMHRRDGIAIPDGLALWERYNRTAAVGLQGIDTYVLDYDSIIDDAHGAIGNIVEWLRGLKRFGPSADGWDLDRGISAIDKGLHHESAKSSDVGGDVSTDHQELQAWLAAVAGGHTPFDALPPAAASPWPEAVLAERREIVRLQRLVASMQDELSEASEQHGRDLAQIEGLETVIERLHNSTSWKVTGPLRSAMARIQGESKG